MRSLRAALVGIALVVSSPLVAQGGPRDNRPLIGTAVYSSDGAEIGPVADVSFDESGRLAAVRIDAGVRLGFWYAQGSASGERFYQSEGQSCGRHAEGGPRSLAHPRHEPIQSDR
jgi:hypothetical protein